MSCDYVGLANPGVQVLQPYQAGKPVDELEREFGIDGIIKLASNENPLGPSPTVLSAIQTALSDLTRYPDSNGFHLKHALSQRFNLDMDHLTLGNGSNDLLELIARTFLREGVEAIYSQYAFIVYALVVRATGAQGVEVPADRYGHDLNAIANAVTHNTRVIFLANPNNPTGTVFSKQEFEAFMARIPLSIIVVLDEAYTEFAGHLNTPNGLDVMGNYPNLIVTRTFSKAYGLAALRVGFAVANAEITNLLNRVRQPFNVSSLGQVAAIAALQDDTYLKETVKINAQGYAQLIEGVTSLGIDFIPSAANFMTVNLEKNAQSTYQALLSQGVIVRPLAVYGLPNHLRVSIGTAFENNQFLLAFKKVIA